MPYYQMPYTRCHIPYAIFKEGTFFALPYAYRIEREPTMSRFKVDFPSVEFSEWAEIVLFARECVALKLSR